MRATRWTNPMTRCAAAWGVLLAAGLRPGAAQPADYRPRSLEGVGITEHRDAQIPPDLAFVDESGRKVTLADYFDGDRPVILTLNYYRCPMLCTLQLNGLIEALKELNWTPGEQFEIVTVSIDPVETPTLAKAKKQSYLSEYGRPAAAKGWHFLTGRQKEIRHLAAVCGFDYKWNEDRREWMHAAALFVCTPDGRLSRYLYGVQFEPQTLRLSLVEASSGKIGSPLDQIILYCLHYDAGAGRYSLAALNLMRAGGAVTVVLVGTLLAVFWRRESRRRRPPAGEEPGQGGEQGSD